MKARILYLDPVGHDDMLLPMGRVMKAYKDKDTEITLACLGSEHRQQGWNIAGIGLNQGPSNEELMKYSLLQEPYHFGNRMSIG